MSSTRDMRRHLRQAIAPVIGVAVIAYFMYHAVQGERGLYAWLKLNKQIKAEREVLDELTVQRDTLHHRVTLLRPESLDRDMLEERSRAVLNYVHADERVILNRR